MRSGPVAEITAEAFAPYGDRLTAPAGPPRRDRAARIENRRDGSARTSLRWRVSHSPA